MNYRVLLFGANLCGCVCLCGFCVFACFAWDVRCGAGWFVFCCVLFVRVCSLLIGLRDECMMYCVLLCGLLL